MCKNRRFLCIRQFGDISRKGLGRRRRLGPEPLFQVSRYQIHPSEGSEGRGSIAFHSFAFCDCRMYEIPKVPRQVRLLGRVLANDLQLLGDP